MKPTDEQVKAAEELGRGLEAHFVLIEGYRQFAKENHSNKPERERYHKLAEKAFADLEAWVAQREAKAYQQGMEEAATKDPILKHIVAKAAHDARIECGCEKCLNHEVL